MKEKSPHRVRPIHAGGGLPRRAGAWPASCVRRASKTPSR